MRRDLKDASQFEKMFTQFLDAYLNQEPAAQEEARKREAAANTVIGKNSPNDSKEIHVHIHTN